MELNEILEENPRLKDWYESMNGELERLAAAGFPHVVPGWPDECHGITHDAYLEEMEDLVIRDINDTEEGEDAYVPTLPTYAEWKEARRAEVTDGDEFSHCSCDLCGSNLAGSRHYVTALPADPSTNHDYTNYEVCSDCYLYVCNGDLPEDI